MRLVHVVQEMPYPPTHGGRVDCWRRVKGLHELGYPSLLVTWTYADADLNETQQDLSRLKEHARGLAVFEVDRSWKSAPRRLFSAMAGWPSHMAARALSRKDYSGLLDRCRVFGPEVVLLDGLHGLSCASRLAIDLGIPIAYRSHNREFFYLSNQRRLSRSFSQKAALTLATQGLERRERDAHEQSVIVLDISTDDLVFWSSEGFKNSIWLPPLCDNTPLSAGVTEKQYDFVYVGNLMSPNNVAGVMWFVKSVWPQIVKSEPGRTALFAGSNPDHALIELLNSNVGIDLKANVIDPRELLYSGKVLINPVLFSSGVNVKMVDMLATGLPIVSTAAGVAGLSAEIKSLVSVCDTADEFAVQCLSRLEGVAKIDSTQRALAEEQFGIGMLKSALEKMKSVIENSASRRNGGEAG